jgi:hypothetical protein
LAAWSSSLQESARQLNVLPSSAQAPTAELRQHASSVKKATDATQAAVDACHDKQAVLLELRRLDKQRQLAKQQQKGTAVEDGSQLAAAEAAAQQLQLCCRQLLDVVLKAERAADAAADLLQKYGVAVPTGAAASAAAAAETVGAAAARRTGSGAGSLQQLNLLAEADAASVRLRQAALEAQQQERLADQQRAKARKQALQEELQQQQLLQQLAAESSSSSSEAEGGSDGSASGDESVGVQVLNRSSCNTAGGSAVGNKHASELPAADKQRQQKRHKAGQETGTASGEEED